MIWDQETDLVKDPPAWSLTGRMCLWADGSHPMVRAQWDPQVADPVGHDLGTAYGFCRIATAEIGAIAPSVIVTYITCRSWLPLGVSK